MPRRQLLLAAVIWVATIAAAALLGYALRTDANVTAVTATAYVGVDQASASVGGWVYAIPVDVAWQGVDASWRQSGRPACLTTLGMSAPVRLGYVPVTGPTGSSWRQVVWVSCIA
jgi:hypothetical protein